MRIQVGANARECPSASPAVRAPTSGYDTFHANFWPLAVRNCSNSRWAATLSRYDRRDAYETAQAATARRRVRRRACFSPDQRIPAGNAGITWRSWRGLPLREAIAGAWRRPTERRYRRSWYQLQRFLAQNRPSTTDSAGASAAAGADPGSNRSARASAPPFAETVPPRRCLSGKATPRTRSDRAHIERLNRNPTKGPVMATMNVTWHANIANQTAVDDRRGDGGMRRGGEGGACHPLTGISCSF